MKPIVLSIITLALALQTAHAVSKIYEITLEDIQGGPRMLTLVFHRAPPSPDAVDKLLRQSLQHATGVDASKDILAMAFVGDETMTPNQYSGALVFVAKQKKIMTMDESRGLKKSSITRARYYVAITDEKTLKGLKPERRWLSVSLVYPTEPSRSVAYEDMIAVIKELATRNQDINMYVCVGDKTKRTSWHQVKDPDGNGAYIFCGYDAKTKRVTRKGAKSVLLSVVEE